MKRLGVRCLGLVLITGLLGSAEADQPPRAKVLVPVVGAKPKDNVEGSTEHAPTPQTTPPSDPVHTHPDGPIGQSVGEREAQLEEEGYDVEVRYFSSLQAFLCWLLGQVQSATPPSYRHVEFYGHGNPSGPADGFPPALTPPQELARWELLGELLRRVMSNLANQLGHIVFGWCKSAGKDGLPPNPPLAGGKYPGGVVAGKSGRPVYGPEGDIEFPDQDPQAPPLGGPFSEPAPKDASTEDTGWRKFPPVVEGERNDGTSGPTTVTPGMRGPTAPRLPFGEDETPIDPHAGNNPLPPPTSPPDTDAASPPPPSPIPPLPAPGTVGC